MTKRLISDQVEREHPARAPDLEFGVVLDDRHVEHARQQQDGEGRDQRLRHQRAALQVVLEASAVAPLFAAAWPRRSAGPSNRPKVT